MKYFKFYLVGMILVIVIASCSKEEYYHYNKSSSKIQARIDAGETPLDIINSGIPVSSLYGIRYEGGLIFYIDLNSGFGYVAHIDNSIAFVWGCTFQNIPGAENISIGSGEGNTFAILNECSDPNSAARYCKDLIKDGFDDWFLPSIDELAQVMSNISALVPGTYTSGNSIVYWSSTDSDFYNDEAERMGPESFTSGTSSKNYSLNTIAIRKFLISSSDIQIRLDTGETPLSIYQSGVSLIEIYGKFYQGGIIFYIDSIIGGGMVLADPSYVVDLPFGCYSSMPLGTSLSFGSGQVNTNFIIANCTSGGLIAAEYCDNFVIDSYQDWYMPSYQELLRLYNNFQANGINTLPALSFLSSSQNGTTTNRGLNMADGTSALLSTSSSEIVIMVRTFN